MPPAPTNDLEALGPHDKGLVVRDLRIYAQALDARVESWRDENGHEVDAVVTARSVTGRKGHTAPDVVV